ncbi:MAG: carbamoyltransferase C-terminal domain-containing protein [Candidatus Omnitrophota bacterium]
MNVLGINHYTDPAACLLVGGKLVACVEEERFTRLKNSHNIFPGHSVDFCLKKAGISIDEVDRIAIPYDAHYYPFEFLRKMVKEYLGLKGRSISGKNDFKKSVASILNITLTHTPAAMEKAVRDGLIEHKIKGRVPKVEFVDHHFCHAITASYYSGFDSALVLIVDGSGESNCTTLYDFENGSLKLLDKYEIPDSLGWFYAGITEFLGFIPYRHEGKTMGLAPYGIKDDAILEKLEKIVKYNRDRYKINPEYLLAGQHSFGMHFSDLLVDLLGSPRQPDEELTQRHKNIAWAAQYVLEKGIKKIVNDAVKKYGKKKVCLAGGVAMNCKMNGMILYETLAEDVFVFPAAGDAGSSVGAAFYASGGKAIENREILKHAYYGPEYTNEQILEWLKNAKVSYAKPASIAKETARLLAKGMLVGWFQGAMEFGARALGNRSILANPLIANMRDQVNKNVKFRENWRPFCPSMLDEQRAEYLQKDKSAPFMIVAHLLKEKYREKLSSICHADGSIRPQTVTKDQNTLYYELLSEFKKLTGHGILLNTSMNVKGEPMVCTPLEAVRCFYSNGLDALAIGPYLLEKNK